MTQESGNSQSSGKGKAFFDRADQVAGIGSWDFAIEMYLEGIQREPGSLERGHKPLRDVSLRRKASGLKPAGMMERMKHGQGKDPIVNLVNAEFLLAKDPGNEQYMELVLKAAQALTLPDVVKWAAAFLLESQRQAERRNKRLLNMILQAFRDQQEYAPAIQACRLALEADPQSNELQDILRDLETQDTIQRGKYVEKGDFLKGVKNVDEMKQLVEKDRLVQSTDFRRQQVDQARVDYLNNPTVEGKIEGYVNALLKLGEESAETEAMEVLAKAHQDTNAYRWKMQIGDIRIMQMSRRFRELRDAGKAPEAAAALREQLTFELQEFTERSVNYPTDVSLKFELGKRQLVAGQLDEAIGSLQKAKSDARHATQASILLGQAFAKKGWYREAADTLQQVMDTELSEDRQKEVRYHLGQVFEKTGDLQKSDEQYSRVAMMDYNYKDVRVRLEEVRKRMAEDQKQ